MQQPSEQLLQAIAVTAELTGTELSKTAAIVMAQDLAQYPEHQVMAALTKCRRELKGRLTIADVISRLEDGRPGPEVAWAMIPHDEATSVVWTTEMAQAFGVCNNQIQDGDTIQARMSFLEEYKRLCQVARDNGVPVKWEPSLGHNPTGRESVLLEAVEKGRLGATHVAGLLPYIEGSDARERLAYLQREANLRLGVQAA